MGRRWCTVITQRRQIYVWLRDGDVSRTCALDHAARASLAAMRNSGTALQRDFSSAAAAWAAGLDEGGSKRSRKGSVPAWRVRRLGGGWRLPTAVLRAKTSEVGSPTGPGLHCKRSPKGACRVVESAGLCWWMCGAWSVASERGGAVTFVAECRKCAGLAQSARATACQLAGVSGAATPAAS